MSSRRTSMMAIVDFDWLVRMYVAKLLRCVTLEVWMK